MSKDTEQASNSFIASAFVCFLLAATVCWIAVLILTIYPDIKEANDILKIMIFDCDWMFGFRGIIFAGIMAMVMSTVDSYINSSSILLVHDLRQALSEKILIDELKTTRICSMLIGLISILFAIRSGSFLELFLWASIFYMPVVTVPFIMTIIGFRSSSKSVLIGMAAGFTTALIWEIFIKAANVGGVLPGMLANLIFLYGSHYFLNQPGGWIKRNSNSNGKNQITNNHNNNLISTKKLSIIAIFQKNTPQNEAMIALLGLFVIASNMISANAISNEIFDKHKLLFDIIYSCTICFTTALISFPLWPRYKNFIPFIWHIGAFFVLICSSFLVVLISNFSEVQLMVFMTNIIVVSTIMNWRVSLSFVTVGIVSTLLMYKNMIDQLQLGNASLEFKVAYLT